MSRRSALLMLSAAGVALKPPGATAAVDGPSATAPRAGSPAAAASSPDELAFGILADAQYCDAPPRGTRYYRESLGKMRACVSVLNERSPAFVIDLGDFIDRDVESFAPLLAAFDRLEAPRYHVLGNHDFAVAPDELPRVLPTLGLDVLGTGHGYHAFEAASGWRCIVLNGCDLSLGACPKGSSGYAETMAMYERLRAAGAANAKPYGGGIGARQLAWFDAELAAARRNGQRVIAFCHFPICLPTNAHSLWNNEALLERVEAQESPVAAWFNGHNHAGGYVCRNGVHHVNLHGMVETESTTAYAVVRVQAGTLKIEGFGREPDRTLALR